MHIVLSWDISAQEPRWSKVNEELRKQLSAYQWHSPVNTFYVIKIASETDRLTIRDALIGVAKGVPERIQFVMTPVMLGGFYNGYLTPDHWAKINALTG